MSSVILEHISKTYGTSSSPAVHDVSFTVGKGEMFGLIGPDGAGKTSLFRILTTLLLPDQGTASVGGFDILKDYKQIRNTIGYMPGRFSLYQDLSVEENLRFFATIFNTTIAENYHLIKDIYSQIEPFKHRKAGKLSGGMKQKLALSCALIHQPSVLFLDEPTTGVDPVSRKEFWEMLARLKENGITIIVSTPYMDEAIRCDRIALIQEGRILSIDTPEKIIASFPDKLFAVKANSMSALLKALDAFQEIKTSYAFGEYAHVTFKDHVTGENNLLPFLTAKGLTEIQLMPAEVTIEDSFIHLLKN
jgi:ABC-type multidrug transport system ATPase subunit